MQFINEMYTGNTLIHYLKQFSSSKIIQQGLLFTLLIALLASALLSYLKVSFELSQSQYFFIITAVLLHSFFCVLILALGKLKTYNVIALLQPLLLLGAVIVQVQYFKGYTFLHYYYSLLFSFAAAIPVSAFLVFQLQKSSTNTARISPFNLVVNGFYLQATALMLFLMNRYNYYLLAENAKVGLYATACTIMEALLLLANGAVPVLLSSLSQNKVSASTVLSVLKLILLLLLPAPIILCVVPEVFFTQLIGDSFVGIKSIMLLYTPAVVLQCMCIITSQFFTANGKQIELSKAYLPAFLFALFVAPIATNAAGYAGAAMVTAASFLIAFVIMYYKYCKINGYSLTALFRKESILNLLKALGTTI